MGAVNQPGGISDPDLAVIVQRWADLPAVLRAGIVAMVRAAAGDSKASQ